MVDSVRQHDGFDPHGGRDIPDRLIGRNVGYIGHLLGGQLTIVAGCMDETGEAERADLESARTRTSECLEHLLSRFSGDFDETPGLKEFLLQLKGANESCDWRRLLSVYREGRRRFISPAEGFTDSVS